LKVWRNCAYVILFDHILVLSSSRLCLFVYVSRESMSVCMTYPETATTLSWSLHMHLKSIYFLKRLDQINKKKPDGTVGLTNFLGYNSKSEQNSFHDNLLISQPNTMMWQSSKSNLWYELHCTNEWLHLRVWVRNKKIGLLNTLTFWRYCIRCNICGANFLC